MIDVLDATKRGFTVRICVKSDDLVDELALHGLAIVPKEPTPEMVKAGDRAGIKASVSGVSSDVYRAMVAATPVKSA